MASYIYNVLKTEHCHECTGDRELRFSTTRKYEAVRFLTSILKEGWSIHDFQVFRSRDGIIGPPSEIDVYEFMQIDLGEVM